MLGARPSAQCRHAAVTLGSSRSFQARGMLSSASITGVNRMQTKYFYDLFICLRPIVAAKELKMSSCLSVCQSGLVFTTKTAVCCIQKRLCKTLPLLFHNIHYIYTLFSERHHRHVSILCSDGPFVSIFYFLSSCILKRPYIWIKILCLCTNVFCFLVR